MGFCIITDHNSLKFHEILVVRVNQVLDNPVEVLFGESDVVNPSSNLISSVPHLNKLIDALLFPQPCVVVRNLHHIGHLISHLVPDHNALSVLYLLWVRLDPFLHEVVSHLLWHLGKDLLGQSYGVAVESVEWHELYDIAVSIPVEL